MILVVWCCTSHASLDRLCYVAAKRFTKTSLNSVTSKISRRSRRVYPQSLHCMIMLVEGANIVQTADGIVIYQSSDPDAASVLNIKLWFVSPALSQICSCWLVSEVATPLLISRSQRGSLSLEGGGAIPNVGCINLLLPWIDKTQHCDWTTSFVSAIMVTFFQLHFFFGSNVNDGFLFFMII